MMQPSSETVGRLVVACPDCGEDVDVQILARSYPVNPVGVMRVGLEPRPASHVCPPAPPGPGAGERLAS